MHWGKIHPNFHELAITYVTFVLQYQETWRIEITDCRLLMRHIFLTTKLSIQSNSKQWFKKHLPTSAFLKPLPPSGLANVGNCETPPPLKMPIANVLNWWSLIGILQKPNGFQIILGSFCNNLIILLPSTLVQIKEHPALSYVIIPSTSEQKWMWSNWR